MAMLEVTLVSLSTLSRNNAFHASPLASEPTFGTECQTTTNTIDHSQEGGQNQMRLRDTKLRVAQQHAYMMDEVIPLTRRCFSTAAPKKGGRFRKLVIQRERGSRRWVGLTDCLSVEFLVRVHASRTQREPVKPRRLYPRRLNPLHIFFVGHPKIVVVSAWPRRNQDLHPESGRIVFL